MQTREQPQCPRTRGTPSPTASSRWSVRRSFATASQKRSSKHRLSEAEQRSPQTVAFLSSMGFLACGGERLSHPAPTVSASNGLLGNAGSPLSFGRSPSNPAPQTGKITPAGAQPGRRHCSARSRRAESRSIRRRSWAPTTGETPCSHPDCLAISTPTLFSAKFNGRNV